MWILRQLNPSALRDNGPSYAPDTGLAHPGVHHMRAGAGCSAHISLGVGAQGGADLDDPATDPELRLGGMVSGVEVATVPAVRPPPARPRGRQAMGCWHRGPTTARACRSDSGWSRRQDVRPFLGGWLAPRDDGDSLPVGSLKEIVFDCVRSVGRSLSSARDLRSHRTRLTRLGRWQQRPVARV